MTKELVSQELHNELKSLSGEMNMPTTKHSFPLIKLDQVTTKFSKGTRVEGEFVNEEVGDTFTSTILRVRRRLNGWVEDASFYSYEYDNPNQKVKLFSDSVIVSEGTPKEIKQDMEGKAIKEQNVLYMLVGDEVMKMYVKGQSLANFFEFMNKKGTDALASFQTVFTVGEEQKKGANIWRNVEFTKGEASSVQQVLEKLKELNSYIIAQEFAASSDTIVSDTVVSTTKSTGDNVADALGLDQSSLDEIKFIDKKDIV